MSCNWSEILNSRPFQQAITRRNWLRNDFGRAIWTWPSSWGVIWENWDLRFKIPGGPKKSVNIWPLLQWNKGQILTLFLDHPVVELKFSCSNGSTEVISEPTSSKYSLLERSWVEDFRSITTHYICNNLQKRQYCEKVTSFLMEYCIILSSSIYVWKE